MFDEDLPDVGGDATRAIDIIQKLLAHFACHRVGPRIRERRWSLLSIILVSAVAPFEDNRTFV